MRCVKGKEWYKDGRLEFPGHLNDLDASAYDGTYRTHLGWKVVSDAVIYGESNVSLRTALKRLNAARVQTELSLSINGPISNYHEWMQEKQRSFVTKHLHLFDRMVESYRPYFEDWEGTAEECEAHHDEPHVKRALRIRAWLDMCNDRSDLDYLWLKKVRYKMKRNEYAKNGKMARMIGDLGVPASLQGFRLTKLLKAAMAGEPIEYLGGKIEFCPKPSPDKLVEIFKQLIEPEGKYYVAYFSDDACYSVRDVNGKVHCYNLDISKCDASHTEAIWIAMRHTLPSDVQPDFDVLVDQLCLPFYVGDCNDHRRKVVLQGEGPLLFSGSTLTTVTNNTANVSVAYALAEHAAVGALAVARAAEDVGYIVTVVDCSADFHLLQFLKHSPVLDTTGQLRALLNPGVLLRASGTCKFDLPGRGPIEHRAAQFQYGILSGAYPRVGFELLDVMKAATGVGHVSDRIQTFVRQHLGDYLTSTTEDSFRVSNEEVFARYGLTTPQINQLIHGMGSTGFGMYYADEATAKILLEDYGLPTTFYGESR